MYTFVLVLHNWSRWLVVIFGLIAVFRAYSGWRGRQPFTGADQWPETPLSWAPCTLQLLLGLLLYFWLSPYGLKAMQALGGAAHERPRDALLGRRAHHGHDSGLGRGANRPEQVQENNRTPCAGTKRRSSGSAFPC